MINEAYALDIGRKIKAQSRQAMKDGDYIRQRGEIGGGVRKAAEEPQQEQVVAANIDIVFLCMALNNDFNLQRLERYISIGWDSGAMPVIVLTKSDLCDDLEQKLSEVSSVAFDVDILVTTSTEENGYKELVSFISEGKTIAFIGSSGVGKSTLSPVMAITKRKWNAMMTPCCHIRNISWNLLWDFKVGISVWTGEYSVRGRKTADAASDRQSKRD